MFWCEYTEENAKRNLRNCIYKLKNIIDEKIIITKGNTYVQINSDLKIIRDIDVFVTENNEDKLLKLKDFIFLDKFYIKDCIEFEKWETSIKTIYEKMYIDKLESGLRNSVKINDLNYMEEFSKKIIFIDPYKESAYRSLMKTYVSKGSYNEAVRLYGNLSKMLKNELDIEPDEETQNLFRHIKESYKMQDVNFKGDSSYYGHTEEAVLIREEYRKYLLSVDYYNCILCGDIGTGKTKIINNFLKKEKVKEFIDIEFRFSNYYVSNFAIEKILHEFVYKYNLDIPSYLSSDYIKENVNYLKLTEYVLDYVNKTNKKPVLVLKNIESIDKESLEIILSCIFNNKYKKIFVIGEFCQSFSMNYKTISKLQLLNNTKLLKLNPLNEQQTAEFINNTLRNGKNSNIMINDVYKNTQGSLMFLHDIFDGINDNDCISYKMKKNSLNKIKELLTSLSNGEVSYLEILSMFENGVEIEILYKVLDEKEIIILDVIDKLSKRDIVTEIYNENHLLVKIKYRFIRDVIYENVKEFKRIEFHKLIAIIYEKEYQNNKYDYFYISELKYHYNFTNKEYEKLYYNLIELEYKLDYSDEFFPTLKRSGNSSLNFYINREIIYEEFKRYKIILNTLDNLLCIEKLYELKMRFNFLLGRTLSRDGKREEGIYYIKELISEAQALNRNDFLLKGYMETIYYGLKNDNQGLMAEYIKKANKIESIEKYEIENGILLRLEGLCNIMNNNYDIAEDFLWKSIRLFSNPVLKSTNFINIAAAYDYLGCLYRNKRDYESSEKFLNKAIDICKEKSIKKSLEIFYEDLGYTYFLKREYDKAEICLHKSIQLYDEFGTYWLRSICESCLSLINMYKGNKDKALEYFRRAEIYSRKDSVKEEMYVLGIAKKQLKEKKII